jgi:uncharacterized membrane protein YebE (DUF533 family)
LNFFIMNPTDILKEILLGGRRNPQSSGKESESGGPFRDIFGGGAKATTASESEVARQARELEDLIKGGVSSKPQANLPSGNDPWAGGAPDKLPPPLPKAETSPERQETEAVILIRAMVQAAKSDGKFTEEEQRAILERMGGQSPGAVEFLRREFAKPVNARELAWSVPLGLEAKAYLIALSAINPDTAAEKQFLDELAHGLRLGPEARRDLESQVRWR